jgi:signal transduction histidine kinase
VLSLRSSLPAKLVLVATIFVVAVATVQFLTVDRLARVDVLSAEVRNRWLDSVRLLGRLNHHVAKIRTEEAEVLLGRSAPGLGTGPGRLQENLDLVTQDIDEYRTVPHDADETLAFESFLKDWTEQTQHALAIEALAGDGRTAEAAALFKADGNTSFQRASDELRRLITLTEIKADAARTTAAAAIAQAQRFVSDLILATLVLFVALAAYVWRSFSQPLFDLAGRMQRLAASDTGFSVPFEHRRDEIGAMARALAVFRRNTVELLESRKKMAMQAEILAGTLDKERCLAAEQRNFIMTMSHEFRTPLSSIDGNAQRLIATADRASPTEIADRAHRIRAAVFRMTSHVVSLTEAMEMAQRPVEPRTSRFDLAAMLGDLVRYYREIGLAGEIEEHIVLPSEITGDRELLHYAFSNLISNAFKYSPDGATVMLTADAKDGCFEVTVEDRGCGIPPDEVDRVRERFYRGSNVGTIPGTGIGLYLVDQIVRQHGGRLHIDSVVGRGTRMIVTLPIDG